MQYSKVLGIFAHPDDADVGAGGTIAQLSRLGAEVTICVVTPGDQGGFDAEAYDDISKVRRREQQASAKELGAKEVIILDGYRDGHIEPSTDLVRDLVRLIREVQPELILTSTPEYNWKNVAASHHDHRAVGEAVNRAVYPAARNPYAFPELLEDEGLEPWTVLEVWMQGHPEPDTFVTLTAKDVDRKVAAMRCHESQFQNMDSMDGFIRERAALVAEQAGLVLQDAAESFLRFKATFG